MKCGPELGRSNRSEVKLRWKNANDDVRRSTKHDRLPKNIGTSAVATLPCAIAEQDSARCAGHIFPIAKVATENRSNTQRAKEAGADGRTLRLLHAGWRVQKVDVVVEGFE